MRLRFLLSLLPRGLSLARKRPLVITRIVHVLVHDGHHRRSGLGGSFTFYFRELVDRRLGPSGENLQSWLDGERGKMTTGSARNVLGIGLSSG